MADEVEHYKVILVSEHRSPQIAAARVHVDSEDCRIELSFDGHSLEATGDDLFESFCRIREQLETRGALPKCYGAHLHAFPSGMSRDMGGGMLLYRLTLGTPALTKNLVHMFEADDDVVPSTVADQREFFDRWIGSPG